ncbi:MAG: hypothetical protein ACQEXJ_00770 [Myxococcota bacterium]
MRRLGAFVGIAAVLLVSACGDGETPDSGAVTIGLPYTGGGWFRMRVFEGPASDALTGKVLFDTGCIEARSRTFEITDLDVGEDRSVVFEAFGGADCRLDDRVALGYRGGVDVKQDPEEQGHYHVPVFDTGAITDLPEDLNLSASTAVKVDFCDEDADCEGRVPVGGGCYKIAGEGGGDFNHWCVPTCESTADCQTLHPRSTCNRETGWCMMRSPFPLNMSEPRAFGHAATLSDGDVLLAGGFGRTVDGSLVASERAFERFDAATDLFTRQRIAGVPSGAVGLAGFAALGSDRFALAGGVLSADLEVTSTADRIGVDYAGLAGEYCGEDGCEPNMSDRLVVFDVATGDGEGAVTTLPVPLAMTAVVAVAPDRILLLGGMGAGGDGSATPRREILDCRIETDLRATCERLGDLTTPRAGAAAVCADDACDDILVVGGNAGGSGAELIRLGGDEPDAVPVQGGDVPGRVFSPRLCGTRLVGGGGGPDHTGPVPFLDFEVSDGAATATPLETPSEGLNAPLLPAVAEMATGHCWVAGGLRDDGAAEATVHRITDRAVAPDPLELHRSRFGGFAAPIQGGPLSGSVLIGGGMTLVSSGQDGVVVTPVRGAEVLRP